MELSVRYILELRDIAGVKEEKLAVGDGSTIQDLLSFLFERYPDMRTVLVDKTFGQATPRVRVLVNGRDMRFLNGFQTPLVAGDLVCVQPATR